MPEQLDFIMSAVTVNSQMANNVQIKQVFACVHRCVGVAVIEIVMDMYVATVPFHYGCSYSLRPTGTCT